MAVWGLPTSQLRSKLSAPLEPYVIQSGLWHSWDMFSPDPLSINFRLEAEILFKDGTTNHWEFPRMEKLGYWQRFQKERYRKWRDRVRQDNYAAVWQDTCRYIARVHNLNPENPPTRVTLIRRWQPIPRPTLVPGTTRTIDFQPIPDDYPLTVSYRFITYAVSPQDL
jgi:hypothetical protein